MEENKKENEKNTGDRFAEFSFLSSNISRCIGRIKNDEMKKIRIERNAGKLLFLSERTPVRRYADGALFPLRGRQSVRFARGESSYRKGICGTPPGRRKQKIQNSARSDRSRKRDRRIHQQKNRGDRKCGRRLSYGRGDLLFLSRSAKNLRSSEIPLGKPQVIVSEPGLTPCFSVRVLYVSY